MAIGISLLIYAEQFLERFNFFNFSTAVVFVSLEVLIYCIMIDLQNC